MNTFRRPHRGYTLMELLVTIAILVLVIGIAVAAMPGMLKSLKTRDTQTLLSRIEQGLESFDEDRGYFPLHPDPPIPGTGIYGDEIARVGGGALYRFLSGDADQDGIIDPDTVPYVEDLPSALSTGGQQLVIDPFGTPIRYLASPRGIPRDRQRTRSSRFDLWSLGSSRDPHNATTWLTR